MTDNKFELAKLEYELVQKQVDKYDDISSKIKTWSITLWIGILGWSFQSKRHELLLLGIVAIVIFWILDTVNKNFRQDYRARREDVAAALRQFSESSSWPSSFSTPQNYTHRFRGIFKQLFILHLTLVYLPLALLTLWAYFSY
ncbi:MAG: hypothetical protein WCX97_01470 [Candidatus Magasanikbacteria bacterium]